MFFRVTDGLEVICFVFENTGIKFRKRTLVFDEHYNQPGNPAKLKLINSSPRVQVGTPELIFFSPTPELARVLNGQKKGDSIKIDKIPAFVNPSGEVSNFLVEDYDAVLSFMNAETQRKKLKL